MLMMETKEACLRLLRKRMGAILDGVIGLAYTLMGLLGMILNGMTAITFIRWKDFHSAPYMWMTGIALIDFIMCSTIGVYAGFRVLLKDSGGLAVEALFTFLDHVGWYGFLTYLTGIDINRFLVICLPHGHWVADKVQNKKLTLWAMLVSLLVISIFSLWISVFPDGLGKVTPIFIFFDEIYTFGWNTTHPMGVLGGNINMAYNVITTTIQPITQAAILWKVIKVKHTVAASSSSAGTGENRKQQIRLFITCIGPNVYCIMTWALFLLIGGYGEYNLAQYMTPYQFSLVHIFWLSNHICNPLFYLAFNQELRAKWFKGCVATSPQSNQNNRFKTGPKNGRSRISERQGRSGGVSGRSRGGFQGEESGPYIGQESARVGHSRNIAP